MNKFIEISLEDSIRELYFWKNGTAGSFTSCLFELIGKADLHNKELISKSFPNVVKAYDLWYHAPSEEQFFKLFLNKD